MVCRPHAAARTFGSPRCSHAMCSSLAGDDIVLRVHSNTHTRRAIHWQMKEKRSVSAVAECVSTVEAEMVTIRVAVFRFTPPTDR